MPEELENLLHLELLVVAVPDDSLLLLDLPLDYYTFFVIPLILPFYFWDKTRQERVIAGSEADWVIVRPAALTNGARGGRLRHRSRVGSLLWTARVSRADVAAFMLDQHASNAYLRAAPGVA